MPGVNPCGEKLIMGGVSFRWSNAGYRNYVLLVCCWPMSVKIDIYPFVHSCCNGQWLLSNNFHKNPFSPFAIELTIKYLFPWAKIELALGYGHNHLTAHDGAL